MSEDYMLYEMSLIIKSNVFGPSSPSALMCNDDD